MIQASQKKFDVVGVGNALVDVLSHISEEFLVRNSVSKSHMHLIDRQRAVDLYNQMNKKEQASGGSVANTVAGLALMGRSCGFIGRVKDDAVGHIFADDLQKLGVAYTSPFAPASADYESGRSMILVTPDGERTMNTYLGAAEHLMWRDFDQEMIRSASWILLEGYRLDGADSSNAFRRVTDLCHKAGGKVAVSLSDPICIKRNRDEFEELIDRGVDMIFANRDELLSLHGNEDLQSALSATAARVDTVVCTLSERGVIIARGKERIEVPGRQVTVVDATGAGDMFAAGFFYGMADGAGLELSARMGCAAASECVSQIGARPDVDLKELFQNLRLIPSNGVSG